MTRTARYAITGAGDSHFDELQNGVVSGSKPAVGG
jgi:hypothetical protein